jgi:acetyl esterase/lipase
VAITLSERLEIAAARAALALPAAAKRRIAGAPVRRDGLELDLDVQFVLKLEQPRPPLSGGTPAAAREELLHAVRIVAGRPIPVADVRELSIAGADGPLRARLYVPRDTPDPLPGPLLVYYHGGGWVAGDLDSHDQPCRLLANTSGARVLSVDYRLAPEHPFPAPVDDAFAAFNDAVVRAAELGADPARIAVGGDSAGAHLAAVTAQQAALGDGPLPTFQLLIYPVTDLAGVSRSRETFAEGFVLTKENMEWYEAQLVGSSGDRRDPRLSPLLAEELAASVPALVVTAGFDPLRDEGEAYARRLQDAGTHALLRRHPGYVHGFMHMLVGGAGPREAIAEIGGVLRAALAA